MSKQKKFNLDDNFKKMFSSTTLNNQNILSGITNIAIEKLIPFKNHPFKLYEGERFTDMVESIKLNGIIMPVIVRPLNEETYEILSGHNRVEAGKSAGLETIPVVIHDSLSEEEALLIVTETNLIQRSFADLSHSERAAALTVHHEAMKNQGKRTDLINEMEKLLKTIENSSNSAENSTSAQIEQKLSSREKTANIYGLNRNTVARYIRIYNNLSKDFNDILDSGKLPFIAAVELSYIPDSDQNNLSNILKQNPELKVDIKKAELLREFSNNEELTPKIIEDILLGMAIKKKNRASLPVQSIRIKGKILSKYFKPENKPEEIEAELITALEFYRAHLNTDE